MEVKSDIELTDLVSLGENVVAPRCQEIHELANSNAAALQTGYGTDAADIAALQTVIEEFKALISKPREAIVGRKDATGDIAQDEETAEALLKEELDRSMRKFKTKNNAFFGEYTSARMIIDLSTRYEKETLFVSRGKLTPG